MSGPAFPPADAHRWRLDTPVALIIFNRPHTTRKVFEQIRAARPPMLLVIADGPRPDRPDEARLCAATREVIREVDWPCDVRTEFSEVNLGCRDRPVTGIDWVFSQVPEAIILEDDCLPHPSFFRFCEELLERYRDDERIGLIGGTNPHGGERTGGASYFFSKYPMIWGWASWRRAWARYDRSASAWPEFRRRGGFRTMTFPLERAYWERSFDAVHSGGLDAWDYQWTLTCWRERMSCIVPCRNLVSNIGFGPGATHTIGMGPQANLATEAMGFPLMHPATVLADRVADGRYAAASFKQGWRGRLVRSLGLSRLLRPRVNSPPTRTPGVGRPAPARPEESAPERAPAAPR